MGFILQFQLIWTKVFIRGGRVRFDGFLLFCPDPDRQEGETKSSFPPNITFETSMSYIYGKFGL